MDNLELLEKLKNNDLALFSTINNNMEDISKEQLKDIILEFCLQVPNYIISPTIQRHFYNDLINELEQNWKHKERL